MEITYSYYLFIIFPIIFYLSSLSYKKIKIIYILNCIICGFLLSYVILFNFTLLAQSTTFEYLFFNPYFTFIILAIIIIIKFSFVKIEMKEKKEPEEWEEMLDK